MVVFQYHFLEVITLVDFLKDMSQIPPGENQCRAFVLLTLRCASLCNRIPEQSTCIHSNQTGSFKVVHKAEKL